MAERRDQPSASSVDGRTRRARWAGGARLRSASLWLLVAALVGWASAAGAQAETPDGAEPATSEVEAKPTAPAAEAEPTAPAVEAKPAAATKAAPAGFDAPQRLEIAPEVGFGWLDPGVEGDRLSESLSWGLGLAVRRGGLAIRGAFRHRVYDRTYVRPGPPPPGAEQEAQIDLDEQSVQGELTAGFDLAPALGWGFRALSLEAYGGVLTRAYINDLFPANLLGVVTGAQAGLRVATGLRFQLGVDYTYDLGPQLFDPPTSLAGSPLGLLRHRAALLLQFPPAAQLTLGYAGSWLAMEHEDVLEHLALLNLTLVWPL